MSRSLTFLVLEAIFWVFYGRVLTAAVLRHDGAGYQVDGRADSMAAVRLVFASASWLIRTARRSALDAWYEYVSTVSISSSVKPWDRVEYRFRPASASPSRTSATDRSDPTPASSAAAV